MPTFWKRTNQAHHIHVDQGPRHLNSGAVVMWDKYSITLQGRFKLRLICPNPESASSMNNP